MCVYIYTHTYIYIYIHVLYIYICVCGGGCLIVAKVLERAKHLGCNNQELTQLQPVKCFGWRLEDIFRGGEGSGRKGREAFK